MTDALLCLTLDDRPVANWLAAAPIMAAHGARVTFCVHALHQATPDELAGLHALQDMGHEIACHSRSHANPVDHAKAHGWPRYLADEVDADQADHRAAGFPATGWASPFHACPPRLRAALATRFRGVRARGPLASGADNAVIDARLKPVDGVADCLGSFDCQHPRFAGWDWTAHLLDRLAAQGGVGVFAGHDIRANGRPGFWATPADLDRLLSMASERGIGFCTLSQISPADRA
ncbi:polysaccharide deacetylase family protein [Paracoccus sp. p4-l81]|uniref:polysaccharide deacetylase family protein n=1 Tax=Paracoccus sp. p4-l81 TaxID=3342806 RepID=UPI0035BB82E8